ncbi:hypothetical protein HE1_00912 [Holospora elegans E1]|uniref:Uncharacterized protein n=1 Tax=Holospora elegans E1 TaxID=1427503 RepID=A0A023E0K4_9PROT|nr:helix-turn-helix domain-containing protein [Holospora elegans]GAJ46577.1 hypothetical protein HE1_00912 [Holospora elegans E1]
MNVRIALKELSFEGGSGTNVKNVEKISRGVPEKDKFQALFLYARGLSMSRIAQRFGISATSVLKWTGILIKSMRQSCPLPRRKSYCHGSR